MTLHFTPSPPLLAPLSLSLSHSAPVLQGEQADWQLPETEAFNVIPGKQFGYAMLRMPL